MATEIIVNDGGAPARILPFIANDTIAAGDIRSRRLRRYGSYR